MDNGKEFTDRLFGLRKRAATGEHEFDKLCAELGIELVERVWDDESWSGNEFDAAVVGTTWDYMEKGLEAFFGRLASLDTLLLNPIDTLRWNADKRYLQTFAERGVLTIPTVWADKADAATIDAAFERFADVDRIVVKPVVGAGAWRQACLRRGEPLPSADLLPPERCLIQPFVKAAEGEGEYSFLFFDRKFSHALCKKATGGDYRVQSMYGGVETVHEPTAEQLAAAQNAVDSIQGDVLYARVDLLRLDSGELALIELEAIEPYLYPEQGPKMGELFAKGLARLLKKAQERA